jgi:tripartite-type tricarboxylate transporter receptor subunit TctC
MNRVLHAVLLGVALAFVSVSGRAQYPVKPIKLIVPLNPGGPPDIAARIIAQKLSESLGQVVVENRPGAGGTLGAAAAAKSPPDGYTLLLGSTGTLASSPSLYSSVGYDSRTSFAPISLIGIAPEAGLPDYEWSAWTGLLAPRGTQAEIIARLNAETVKALATREAHNVLANQGIEPAGNTPEQFAAFIDVEVEKWSRAVKASGAKVD